MSTHPHLELIEGGLTSDDAEWHRFCERIGWQQIGEPTVSDDYEDRLVERIFDAPDHSTSESSASESAVLEHPVMPIGGEIFPSSAVDDEVPSSVWRSSARAFGAAIAMAAVVALAVVALSRVVGDAPPAARTVPTPALERTPAPPSPLKATPDGHIPPLVRSSEPEPAPRHARTPPAPRRSAPLVLEHRSQPSSDGVPMDEHDGAIAGADPEDEASNGLRVAAISPEAEHRSSSVMSATLPVHLSLPVVDASVESRPLTLGAAPSAPTWPHLAMTPGSIGADHRAVALVDVVEAGRSLRGAL